MTQKRRVPPIIWTFLFFLVLMIGSTSRYAKTADTVLIVLRLSILVAFSVIAVRQWWKYQHRSESTDAQKNTGNDLLRRLRAWATDDWRK